MAPTNGTIELDGPQTNIPGIKGGGRERKEWIDLHAHNTGPPALNSSQLLHTVVFRNSLLATNSTLVGP